MAWYAFDGASPFDLAAAKANGALVITGYIVGNPGGYAPISKARVDQIRAMGMGFLPNWERAADFFSTCTIGQAQAAGAEAAAACCALGVPADGTVAVPFSFDFQVPASRFAEMGAKIQAVKAGLGTGYLPRAYAQSALIDWFVSAGILTGKHWLMMSTFNQQYSPASPNVCMVQGHDLAGQWLNNPVAGTDINLITDPASVHAWWPEGSPYFGGQDMLADERAALLAMKDILLRLSFGLDNGGPVPFSSRGEVVDRLRSIDRNTIAQPVAAEAVAQAVATKLPAYPVPPTAAEVASATAAQVAALNADQIAQAVIAQLPPHPTKEEIAAAVRSEITTNPLTIH